MKRKRINVKPHGGSREKAEQHPGTAGDVGTQQPLWRRLPEGCLIDVIRQCEAFKIQLRVIDPEPETRQRGLDKLRLSTRTDSPMVDIFSTVGAAGKMGAKAWLAGEAYEPPACLETAETQQVMAHALCLLWETFLAIRMQGGSAPQARWLAERPLEERRLLTRLRQRITHSIR